MFDKSSHCEKIKSGDAAMLFVALYLIAMGTGGIKASLASHGADQFDDKDPKEVKYMSRYFNYLLLSICIGGSVSLTIGVWLQDNKGWD